MFFKLATFRDIQGLSEQLQRTLSQHNIKSTFYTATTLRKILPSPKDPIPTEKKHSIIYKLDCKDCDAVYIGKSKRAYQTRIGEHISAVRKADTRRYKTADHCWKFNHDFNWTENKILGHELNTTTRKIKETIHSIRTENCINGISYKLPDIWLPAIKVKHDEKTNRKQPPKFTKQSPLGSAIPKARQKLPYGPHRSEFNTSIRLHPPKHLPEDERSFSRNVASLKNMIQDKTNCSSEILLYSRYLRAKLSWDLIVADINKTWIVNNIDNICRQFIRRWLEIPSSGTLDLILLSMLQSHCRNYGEHKGLAVLNSELSKLRP